MNSPIQKILIVDDEIDLRKVLNQALTGVGYHVLLANNGKEALELIEKNDFDLIISDIEMPQMDGIELLKQVKSQIPDLDVIIITGFTSKYSYVDIMNAGASDYVSKPFDMNSMLARINRVAREKKNLLDLKRSNQELCVAIDRANRLAMEAREASKAKTFFLASMSHEIRTPLNGIVGYTDMLMDTLLDDEQKMFLNNAKMSCETLLSVVNDILDFSKVEAGKLNLERIPFDPEVLCFDTIDVVRTKLDETKVELIVSVGDDVPCQVKGDPHRFRQVLLNLLSNAVKFTKTGFIKLSIDATAENESQSRLAVCVTDTGIGIPENKCQTIFEPFIQSEDDITYRYGGTGLGLAISKNIAIKMGGDVRAENNPDQGACFTFTALLETLPNKKVKRVRSAALINKKVLLSTHSKETQKILTHEFEQAGMIVVWVDFQDLESFLTRNENHGFHIAVIDFGKLVKQSDLENEQNWTKKISFIKPSTFSYGTIACSIPVPGISQVFGSLGFKGYLPKPISRAKLFDMIAYVMGMADEEKTTTPIGSEIITSHLLSENKKHGASILLVEDNPVNQKMTQLMLSKAGYNIEIAVNGREAVKKYSQNPHAYDLIFMDINMPVMNGFDATLNIREYERAQSIDLKIPILALTANVLDDFKHKCTQVGMDGFLTKPIKRELVFNAIHQWIR